MLVKAEANLDPIAPTLPTIPGGQTARIQSWVPQLSSVAIAGSGSTGDPAVTGSVIVDVYNFTTTASINPDARVNSSTHGGSGQTLEVTAKDDTHIINLAGGIAISTGGVGAGISVIVDVINKDVSASIGNGANVWAGGTITVQALSTENLFELAVVGAVSTSSAGIAGSFIVLVMNGSGSHMTTAYIGSATVHSGGLTHVKASDTANQLQVYAGNVAIGDSAGIGVATSVIVRNGNVDAHVSSGAQLTVGSLTLEADQTVDGIVVAGAGTGGGDAAVAGSVVVDVQNDHTTATLDGTTVATRAAT